MEKVALYCRLSKEDQDKISEGDDSDSIVNQKMLLVDYATENNYQIYKIYSDDDFSGADQKRPQWNQMLKDAQNGEFDIIICKNQSRFTREMEVVERYIHGFFVEWGIRFIGVVDGVDTDIKNNKKNRQINGLVNEWYLEDTSDNIRSIFKKMMKDGKFLGAFCPYGYKKDENNKYKMIIDEDAANVVKLIFSLSMQGYGVDTISQKLTALGIPTPSEYKKQKGYNFYNPNGEKYSSKGIWGTTTLKRILNNDVYIGILTQGREKRLSYKNKKVVIAPKEEWIIVENNHEPIISKEIFYKTQEILKMRRKTCKTTAGRKYEPHLFSGRIFCADCGSTMAKTSGRLAGGHDYFICQLSKKSKQSECSRHSIRYDKVEAEVDAYIRDIQKKAYEYGNNKEYIKNRFMKNKDKDKQKNLIKNQLDKISVKINDNNNSITSLYTDKVKKVISEDEFIMLKTNFGNEIEKLESQKKQLELEYENYCSDDEKIDNFENAIIKHMNYEKLTFEIVNDFIKRIKVYEPNEEGYQIINITPNI